MSMVSRNCWTFKVSHVDSRPLPPAKAEADSIMERFEGEEAEAAAKRRALLENPTDDDGFVTVTYKKKRGRSGTNAVLPLAGDLAGVDAAVGGKKKKKGAGSLPDFYRFQVCFVVTLGVPFYGTLFSASAT